MSETDIQELINERNIFPCFFGSALKDEGVSELLEGIRVYTRNPEYPDVFSAKVYKIARDAQGSRLTYLKVTGGRLKVKSILSDRNPGSSEEGAYWEEKTDQLRIYSGAKYESVQEVEAGRICAVTGLTKTFPGEGLGAEEDSELPVLEPVLNYQVELPPGCDAHQMLRKLRQLEEEEPQLHIVWDERAAEIHMQLMGEVQTEILKRLIWDRFQVAVDFGEGKIVYKETIETPSEGIGHFEPLRHYAEVHLLLEPGEPGSGLQFYTACSEDVLNRNWQRLILTHLEEREHPGVLTGSPVTDMQITLLTGRAHIKHTEGGDFRQATYRAVRQGLKKAKSILLEPYYEFRLEIPEEVIGKAMNDIQQMGGSFQPPAMEGQLSVLTGTAPVSSMRNYQKEVVAYTHGKGRLFCNLSGYAPCRNQEEIVAQFGYDPENDPDNPTGSVFCAHGAGFLVPWDQVDAYAHLETLSGFNRAAEIFNNIENSAVEEHSGRASAYTGTYAEEKELQAIFERTFGPVNRDRRQEYSKRVVHAPSETVYRPIKQTKKRDEYLLVDGYNVIFAWDELRELSLTNMDAARDRLIDLLSDYQGYKKCTLIIVFDAYKQEGHREEILKYHNVFVVYTREAETADQYIEKTVHKIGRQNDVTVATSDGMEKIIILGQGARRLPSSVLKEEIEQARQEMHAEWKEKQQSSRNLLIDNVSDEMRAYLQNVRLGKKQLDDPRQHREESRI